MNISNLKLDENWRVFFEAEFEKEYMKTLFAFLSNEIESGKNIFPISSLWFDSFETLEFDKIKCVVLGQDPYFSIDKLIGKPQAVGKSFSVPKGAKIPPSLRNIYKEMKRDLGINVPNHGDISCWASEGVFMLNASLTVEEGLAGSHLKRGWQEFTKSALKFLNDNRKDIVFLSWGNFAHKCCEIIDENKHHVIKTSHPSPLGATKSSENIPAFMGSGCFSKANNILENLGKSPIVWDVR